MRRRVLAAALLLAEPGVREALSRRRFGARPRRLGQAGTPDFDWTQMNTSQKKVLQYLGEAQASEVALVRVLQSQIAMTSRGAYRTALEQHLRETRDHADRVAARRR